MGATIKTNLEISTFQRRDTKGEERRNAALKRAINYAKVPLLANLVYFGWRWFNVLSNAPGSSGSEISAWIAFLLVEGTFAVSGLLNCLLISGLGKKWTPQKHLRAKGENLPRVDVFLPCYGESIDVIRDTINAAIRQDYPTDKYRVVVLDDGGSQEVRQLIAELNEKHPAAQLHYGARGADVKIHSKAANIAFGLELVKTLPDGAAPYFGVVDIDMILGPEWLSATVPFLEEDEQVALAGSPQKFYNLPQGFCLAPRFLLESDVVQRVFDSSGKAVCQGTGYVGRVSAFDAIGGFPCMVKQEDSFIVSIILAAYGFKCRILEEEHQHGLNALSYTDMAKLQVKWMTGIMHAYSLFGHPVLADKPVGKRITGLIPILHLTIFRLFLIISLPTILWLARSPVVPNTSSNSFTITLVLAFIAYSSLYIMSWMLSEAAEGTISLDDGTRLWNLPYQLKGLLWLAYHTIFGESKMTSFLTTGADCAASRKRAASGFFGRLTRTVVYDGAWMHMVYLASMLYVLYQTITGTTDLKSSQYARLATSIAFPPFTKILIDCIYNAFTPVIYCLSPDPNKFTRESFLQRDEKTGVARPLLSAITPPKPAFWGTMGITGLMWLHFAVAPLWVAAHGA